MDTGPLEYHERTKHSPQSVRSGSRGLDFDNKPRPYKVYTDRPAVAMADRIRPPQQPALSAITEPTANGGSTREPDENPGLETLTTLCYYAAGITTEIELRNRTAQFRAAATTGALYHVDLYVVCGDLGGNEGSSNGTLPAGVYHFDPRTLSLDVLRKGDHRGVLAAATGADAVTDAPISIVTTSTWWRNAWKYAERTFRHAFWDSGTTLANLLAVAHALEYRAEVLTAFADGPVVDLLGLDPNREAPLEVVPIGADDPVPSSDATDPTAVDSIDPTTEPLSPNEKQFPLIGEAWRAGTLADGGAAERWRDDVPAGNIGTREPGDGKRVALEPVDHETASSRPLHETIDRRGSCREYARESISFRKLSTVLDRALRGVPMDGRQATGGQATAENGPTLSFVDPYLLVNGVDGLESGTYHYHPDAGDAGELERLQSGEFRREASHLALDQSLGGDAAVCVYFLTNLEGREQRSADSQAAESRGVVDALGARGYRAAQLEASVTAGRLYLGTYAHRTLGGTGLTFYDDVVTDFFAPRASGQTPMFLYTIGRPA